MIFLYKILSHEQIMQKDLKFTLTGGQQQWRCLKEILSTNDVGSAIEHQWGASHQNLWPFRLPALLVPACFHDNFADSSKACESTQYLSYKSFYFLKQVWFLLLALCGWHWIDASLVPAEQELLRSELSGIVMTNAIPFSWYLIWCEPTTYVHSHQLSNGGDS